MLAYMNARVSRKTLETRETWFWSRSAFQLVAQGETSGNTQRVIEVLLDCDGMRLLWLWFPNGPACHTGAESCFTTRVHEAGALRLPR